MVNRYQLGLLLGTATFAGALLLNVQAASAVAPTVAQSASPSTEMLADGKQTFAQYCSACHGPTGHGGPAPEGGKPARDLTQGAFQDSKTDQQLFTTVHDGVPPDYFMEAWGDRLTAVQIHNVVSYVRSLRAPGNAEAGGKP